VPGWRLNQIFFKDPAGLKVELTFDMEREDQLPLLNEQWWTQQPFYWPSCDLCGFNFSKVRLR